MNFTKMKGTQTTLLHRGQIIHLEFVVSQVSSWRDQVRAQQVQPSMNFLFSLATVEIKEVQ